MEHWEILFGKGTTPAGNDSTDDWAEDETPAATVTPSRFSPPTAADIGARANEALGEFRSMLGTRRDAEEMLAAAVEARQRALTEADEMVRQAEVLAREIETQARSRAEQVLAEATTAATRVTTEAEARAALADAELAKARQEAEQVRDQARAEATAQRAEYLAEVDAQASRTILRLEGLADDLDLALERAKDDLVETLLPLTELRNSIPVNPADLDDEPGQNQDHEAPQQERRRNPFRSR